MPLPALHPGHDPTTTPATANRTTLGDGKGGRVEGLVPHAIRAGVNIAFGSPANSDAPLWQNLNELGPT